MIISSEYESKPEAVKKTTDRPLKISAGKIKIIDLNDGTFKKSEIEEKLHQSAELVSQAFKEEKITNLMYDLSRPENLRTWRRLNEYSGEKLHQAGEKIILAEADSKVAGAAYLRNSDTGSLFMLVRIYLPGIIKLSFSLIKALNLRRIFKSGKLFKTDKIPVDNYYNLEVIGVGKEYQGQGIARLLLEEADNFAKKTKDCQGIYLYTAGENTRDIYKHLGYQLIDQKENADLTVYHMFKMKIF